MYTIAWVTSVKTATKIHYRTNTKTFFTKKETLDWYRYLKNRKDVRNIHVCECINMNPETLEAGEHADV